MTIRQSKIEWAKAVSRLAAPLGPALWFPIMLGAALVLNAGNGLAQNAAPVRIAGGPLNILVPGMDTSPRDVIGWPVYGPALERLGAVESIYSDASGKIAGAVIALTPEKGEQAKSVSVPRSDFVVHIGKFTMSMPTAALRGLPAYEYASAKERGTVLPAGSLMTAAPLVVQPVPVAAAATPEFSGNALIGAPVRNLADEAIGSVSDLVLDEKGQLQAVMVSIDNSPGRSARLESHEVRVVREEGGATVLTGLARRTVTNRDMLQQASIR
jgi:hypothetical protein